mgnify:CR=1 FL=1
MLRNPRILILDEATSNLDIELEKSVNNSIIRYLGDSTVIFITHRLETTENCDAIYKLENGQILLGYKGKGIQNEEKNIILRELYVQFIIIGIAAVLLYKNLFVNK